jgi:hypothetical protein
MAVQGYEPQIGDQVKVWSQDIVRVVERIDPSGILTLRWENYLGERLTGLYTATDITEVVQADRPEPTPEPDPLGLRPKKLKRGDRLPDIERELHVGDVVRIHYSDVLRTVEGLNEHGYVVLSGMVGGNEISSWCSESEIKDVVMRYVRLDTEPAGFQTEKIEVVVKDDADVRGAITELLAKHGIDSSIVRADGWDRQGYTVWIPGEHGAGAKEFRRDWPASFTDADFEELNRLFRATHHWLRSSHEAAPEPEPTGQERAKLTTDWLAESASALRAVVAKIHAARSGFGVPLTLEEVAGERRMIDLETLLLEGLVKLQEEVAQRRHTQADIEITEKYRQHQPGQAVSEWKDREAAHDDIRAEAL